MVSRFVLVTGGNKGIGLAICQGLLTKGFEVILSARSLNKAKQAAEQLSSPKVHPLELDVTDDRSIHLAAKDLRQQISHLDVLINNAGIYPDNGVNVLNDRPNREPTPPFGWQQKLQPS